MATSEGLQERFDRNLMFSLRIQAAGELDPAERLGAVIAHAGGRVSDVELIEPTDDGVIYELTVFVRDDEQLAAVKQAILSVEGVELLEVTDWAMESHLGGACEMRSRSPITSNTDLRVVYTPGVARVCKAIQADPSLARRYTNIANKVAIVTNGTAILGLGDIGALAGMPVMEGKAAIFWEFAGISAEPILVDTHDPDEFIEAVVAIAPTFGAIQVEDVKAPECFKITRELDRRLDIPVMHDDQYGTATIVLAGLYSALKQTGGEIGEMATAICGAGAAGTAIADILLKAGAPDVVLCDSVGVIHRGRSERMNEEKLALAEWTNKKNIKGSLAEAVKGCRLFIGVSQPNIVTQEMVRSMSPGPIVFALANPVSEISRADAVGAGAAVYADGRMMNNAIAYPGIFRGALDAEAEAITIEMMMAAAAALAEVVPPGELMPEMMDPNTHEAVAEAVKHAAVKA